MKCRICDVDVGNIGGLTQHRKITHPEEEAKRIQGLNERRLLKHPPKTAEQKALKPGGDGHGAAPADATQATSFIIKPPAPFTITSSFIWLAREAAINYWGWPSDITMDDFLDNYLYLTLKQRGITLHAMILEKKEGKGNGETDRGAETA